MKVSAEKRELPALRLTSVTEIKRIKTKPLKAFLTREMSARKNDATEQTPRTRLYGIALRHKDTSETWREIHALNKQSIKPASKVVQIPSLCKLLHLSLPLRRTQSLRS